MPIQSISQSAFDQLHLHRRTSAAWMQEKVEWFTERSRVFVGYIVKDVRSSDWSFVIEGRDERGEFHPIESRDHIGGQEEARKLLETGMNELMATGVKVFHRTSHT